MTAHFEHKESLVSILLDIMEVACSHLGINLAVAFVQILDKFGISNQVSV